MKEKSIKAVHISTVHPVFDTRIFYKECKSLVKAGYEVHLIVQHEKDEIIDGIYIHALPKPKNRKERVSKLRKVALQRALKINAKIYHFHDPELIPLGLKLRKFGKKVIYDVHEDVPRQILSKEYLYPFLRPLIAKTFEIYENWASKKFNVIITATPHIRDRFIEINPNTIDINNYPKLDELFEPIDWEKRKNEICYIGGISRNRGIVELVKSLEYTDTVLHLAGKFESEKLKNEVMSLKGWKKVKYYGFVDRQIVKRILGKVKIGVVTLHPTVNYLYSLPIKMFEYMSAGIPVLASDFPLWKEILEKNNCGVLVNPLNPKDIADGINYLLSNDNLMKQMGETGKILVKEKYNWENESRKLVLFYKKIVG